MTKTDTYYILKFGCTLEEAAVRYAWRKNIHRQSGDGAKLYGRTKPKTLEAVLEIYEADKVVSVEHSRKYNQCETVEFDEAFYEVLSESAKMDFTDSYNEFILKNS